MVSQKGRYKGAHKVTLYHEQTLYFLPLLWRNIPGHLCIVSLAYQNQMDGGPDFFHILENFTLIIMFWKKQMPLKEKFAAYSLTFDNYCFCSINFLLIFNQLTQTTIAAIAWDWSWTVTKLKNKYKTEACLTTWEEGKLMLKTSCE